MVKKSGRRKPPKRRFIPPKTGTRSPSPAPRGPLMPVVRHEEAYSWLNSDMPADLAPLYALIGIFRYDSGGKPANSCISASYQYARALHLLGFEAHLMVACATVLCREKGTDTRITDVGLWDRLPEFRRSDQQYSGHIVLYSPSFTRLVDLTIAQDTALQRRITAEPSLGLPIVLSVSAGSDFNVIRPATFRGRYLIIYQLFANLLHTLTPFWEESEQITQMERASRDLASWALDVLRTVDRENPERWRQTAPHLRQLIDGVIELPEAAQMRAQTRPWETLIPPG